MRYRLATTLAIGALLVAPEAFGQASAGFPPTPSGNTPSHIEGSGQGSYLGQNPAAPVVPNPRAAQLGSLPEKGKIGPSSKPIAFCDAESSVPSRCRGRAEEDHAMCVGRGEAGYVSCRRALDQIGWHN
jgi:hypothetical protein